MRAELGVLDASAQPTIDYVALQKSLGLGWEPSSEGRAAR
jgi:hypothetical protein